MKLNGKTAILTTAVVALTAVIPSFALPIIRRFEAHHELIPGATHEGQTTLVEIYWQAPAHKSNRKFPAIIYVHGIQKCSKPGAQAFVSSGILNSEAKRGLVAVAVSLPGYGQSDGVADFCGAASQANLELTVKYLRQRPDVDSSHIGLLGISCVATVAGMVASRSPVAAVILISGVYDFEDMYLKWQTPEWHLHPDVKDELSRSVSADCGADAASAVRSLLPRVSQLTIPTLVIAGGKDHIVDHSQSETLHNLLDAQGTPNQLFLDIPAPHQIPVTDWREPVDNFVDTFLLNTPSAPKSQKLACRPPRGLLIAGPFLAVDVSGGFVSRGVFTSYKSSGLTITGAGSGIFGKNFIWPLSIAMEAT